MNILLTLLSAAALCFSHLSVKDGLTAGSVTDIWFDENGIAWIATGYGLNTYDGTRVKKYLFDEEKRSNSVMRVCGDSKGTIFVATKGEVYSINQRTGDVQVITNTNSRAIAWANGSLYVAADNIVQKYTDFSSFDVFSLNDTESISAISIKDGGDLWLGTFSGEVFRYSLSSGRLFRWTIGSMIENLYEDSRGNIWVSSLENGLSKIDPTGNLSRIPVSSEFVRTVCEDELGNFWIGTYTGLDRLSPDGSLYHYTNDYHREESLSNNSVWVIRRDGQGTMWIGTFFGGVNLYNPELDIYYKYPVSGWDGRGLSSPIISRIEKVPDGSIWVSTEGLGLNRIDSETGNYSWYIKGGKHSLTENNIKDLFLDNQNNVLWVGTHLGGLNKIDLATGNSKPFSFTSNPDYLDILSIADYGDSLMVSTEKGVLSVSKTTGGFRVVDPRRTSLIMAENDESFWVSFRGLFKFKPNQKYSELVLSKSVNHMCKDASGRIWLTDNSRRVTVYSPQDSTSINLDLSKFWPEGERANAIMQSPKSGNIFVASSTGFSIIDPETFSIRFIDKNSGFPLSTTNANALNITRDGVVFIGGVDGLVSFSESSLQSAKKPYRLSFTGLSIDGEECSPDGKILKENLPYAESIVIPPKAASFSLAFCSPDRSNVNNSVEYYMDGLSSSWNKAGTGRELFFSNLAPGRYTLRIRPSDPEQLCGETRLRIKVLAPWYLSLFAKIVYIILALALACVMAARLKILIKEHEAARLKQLRADDAERFKIFERATAVLYHNLDNSDFDVSSFAKEMALSRTALFEKIKDATGKTPGEFLLDIRLKEGAGLLRNNRELNVGEIADRVGFNSSRYFSKCFKDRYGKTPLEYRNSN